MVNVDAFMFAIPVPPFPSHIWVDSQFHPYVYCSDSESFDMPDHIAAHLQMSSEIKLPQRRDSTSSSDEETITSEDDEGDDSVSILPSVYGPYFLDAIFNWNSQKYSVRAYYLASMPGDF